MRRSVVSRDKKGDLYQTVFKSQRLVYWCIVRMILACKPPLGPSSVVLHTLVYRIDVHARLIILRKNPPYMVLFWSARLLILRKSSPLHVYSILHVYWYWYVQNFTLLMIQNKVFQSIAKAIPKYSKVFQSIPKYPKTSQSIPKFQWQEIASPKFPPSQSYLVCTFIDFEKILPPARLFFPAQQSYFGLHVY